MNLSQCCPVCGAQIVSKLEQFRSDNEPSTLASMCSLHGTVGNLCEPCLRSSDNTVTTTSPRLRPSLVSESPTCITNKNSVESWINDCEFHAVKVDMSNLRLPDMTSSRYVSVKTSCITDDRSCSCARDFSHPLHDHFKGHENGIGAVVQSKTSAGPFLINKIKMLSGMNADTHTKDLPIAECECAVMHNNEDGSASMCYKNKHGNYSSAVSLSRTCSSLVQTLHNPCTALSDRHTRLCARSFQNSWLSQTFNI